MVSVSRILGVSGHPSREVEVVVYFSSSGCVCADLWWPMIHPELAASTLHEKCFCSSFQHGRTAHSVWIQSDRALQRCSMCSMENQSSAGECRYVNRASSVFAVSETVNLLRNVFAFGSRHHDSIRRTTILVNSLCRLFGSDTLLAHSFIEKAMYRACPLTAT